jgi:hypothetical protein
MNDVVHKAYLPLDKNWWRAVLEGRKIKSVIFESDITNPVGLFKGKRITGFELDDGIVINIMADGRFDTKEPGPFAYGTGDRLPED